MDHIDIPYGKEFGGTNTDAAPCTRNGFTGARNGEIVPEFVGDRMKPAIGAELHKVVDGKDEIVAIYNGDYFQRSK